jgi:hypothetical protein
MKTKSEIEAELAELKCTEAEKKRLIEEETSDIVRKAYQYDLLYIRGKIFTLEWVLD